MKKSFYTILISGLLLGTGLLPTKALAECTQTYGGSQSCTSSNEFSIEKTVQTPGKVGGSYVDNLSINDPKYSPTSVVSFKILVKNTGSEIIPTLTISDTFPQFLSFVSGPGSFDSNSKKLTLTVTNLQPGQSQTYDVTGKVSESNLMPSDQGVICLVNQAQATDGSGATNTSSSQFCVEKSVLGSSQPQVFTTKGGITTTPATGPEMLPLMALIPGGLGGILLRRKSIKK
jgi:hypothetical protein